MPKGYEFSQEIKRLIFHVIVFVQLEEYGEIIPLKNVDERLMKMLNISQRSVTRLKHELKELRKRKLQEEQHLKDEEEEEEEETDEEEEVALPVLEPIPPLKKG